MSWNLPFWCILTTFRTYWFRSRWGATAMTFKYPYLLVHLCLVISEEMKKKISVWELSSYQAGCIPDCCVVRLFKYINWFCSISIHMKMCFYQQRKTIVSIGWFYNHLISRMGFSILLRKYINIYILLRKYINWFCSISIHMKMCFYQQRKTIVSIGWFYNHLISRMGFSILLRTHLYFESRARCLRLTAMCSTKMTLLIRLWMSQAITACQQTGLSSYSTTSIWQYGRVDVHEV